MYQDWFKGYEQILDDSEDIENKYEIKLIIKNCISEPFFSKRVDKIKINKKQLQEILKILKLGDD